MVLANPCYLPCIHSLMHPVHLLYAYPGTQSYPNADNILEVEIHPIPAAAETDAKSLSSYHFFLCHGTSLEIPLLTSHLQYNQGPTVPYVQAPFANHCFWFCPFCFLFTFDIPHFTGFSVLLVYTSFLTCSFPKHFLSFPTKPIEGC